MKLMMDAGLPAGVINFIPGRASVVGDICMSHPDLAGIHFTGSTAVFRKLWRDVANNLENLRSYPRIVGETGGKGVRGGDARGGHDEGRGGWR